MKGSGEEKRAARWAEMGVMVVVSWLKPRLLKVGAHSKDW